MQKYSLPVRVYYEDTDAGGLVYYVNYLKFMERARTEWLRYLGFNQADLDVLFVVTSAQINYVAPAHLDDALKVELQLSERRAASLTFAQKIVRQQQLLCSGTVRVACVNRQSLRPCRLPETLVQTLLAVDA